MDKQTPILKSQVVERISVGPASKVWTPSDLINFGDYGMPEDRVIGFVTEASSLYYPEFGALIFEYIDSWLAEVERDEEEDDE